MPSTFTARYHNLSTFRAKESIECHRRRHHSIAAMRLSTDFGETRAVVKTVECLFCRYYGRVEGEIGKRKRTNNVKFFQMPFPSDNIKKHVEVQHTENWAEYSALPTAALFRRYYAV